jgi:hypothetical protein
MSIVTSVQFFVIFHKKIFDECYVHVPREILDRFFTFIAVNEKIPKEYTDGKYNILKEWELPIYDPSFQARGYNENSVIRHIFLNKIHKKYERIGFFQYDQAFQPGAIEKILTSLSHARETPEGFYHALCPANFATSMIHTWNEPLTLSFLIDDWNRYYDTRYTMEEVAYDSTLVFPLLNTYVIPCSVFAKYMPWICQLFDKMYPWCVEFPNKIHHGHIGGIYERVMAFAIAMQKLPFIIPMDINHDHNYKSACY